MPAREEALVNDREPNRLEGDGFTRTRGLPTPFAFSLELRISLGQTAQFLEVTGQRAVNLA
jgi:hypothetical protein